MMAEGLNFAKAAYIISEHAEELARVLMKRLNRGATGIPVRGMYSGRQKNMLFCTVARKQLHVLKRMVAELDPSAFLIILDAREVLYSQKIRSLQRLSRFPAATPSAVPSQILFGTVCLNTRISEDINA